MRAYDEFLNDKAQDGTREGFAPVFMPSSGFDFQQAVTEWQLWKGKSAGFLDCGMGKTWCELVWAENVVRKTNKPVLLLTPLAVSPQTVKEGAKFGIEAYHSRDGKTKPGINVTNYERLQYFDPNEFSGVVCDESSCLKAFNGKRRAAVTEFMRRIPYRLMATATPSPNDYIELGTTSEALGVMGQLDMLGRFFRNDNKTVDMRGHWRGFSAPRTLQGPGWRFKGHAEIPFHRWVCSWARAGRKPSDLGAFDDGPFVLPELIEREHIVETRTLGDGYLFALPASNMHEERDERRRTIQERCEMAAQLVADTKEPYVIWCHLNDEGDLIERLCSDAVQITGSEPDEAKEEKWAAFVGGQTRGMVTKQRIGGWGLNLQFCRHVVEFASHSFEAHYQGVRRCWRFGQTKPVINDIIATEGERGAKENMQRKSKAADRLFDNLVLHMNQAMRIESGWKFTNSTEVPAWL